MIGAYHQLWRIGKSFRMSKHDLRARPIYYHKRKSIDAHLAIIAIVTWIERTYHRRRRQEALGRLTPRPLDLRSASFAGRSS
ncbi:MAG: hypothetical protein ABJA87_12740 [bacterium]